MISLEELIDDTNIMISTFRVPFKKVPLGTNLPATFELAALGVTITCIFPDDYSVVLGKLHNNFPNYRHIFITTSDNMFEKKDEVIWELMRSGYMRFVRLTYPRQFADVVQHGLGHKIIKERLKIWGNKNKYKYLIQENEECLRVSVATLLNYDTSFFDYMPEKPMEE